jgi:hypothetical protein
MTVILGVVLAGLWLPAPGVAQDVVLGGELRPRYEARDPVVRDWTDRQTRDFVSMRTRASVLARLPRGVRGFVQLQDVREWGADPNTMALGATGLDLHQGWIEIGHEATADLSVRAGRQELVYGEERLVGAVDWAQQARAFNGVRVRARPLGGLVLDGLAMPIGDEDVGEPGSGAALYGVYGVLDRVGTLDAYLLYNTEDSRVGEPAVTHGSRTSIPSAGAGAPGRPGSPGGWRPPSSAGPAWTGTSPPPWWPHGWGAPSRTGRGWTSGTTGCPGTTTPPLARSGSSTPSSRRTTGSTGSWTCSRISRSTRRAAGSRTWPSRAATGSSRTSSSRWTSTRSGSPLRPGRSRAAWARRRTWRPAGPIPGAFPSRAAPLRAVASAVPDSRRPGRRGPGRRPPGVAGAGLLLPRP